MEKQGKQVGNKEGQDDRPMAKWADYCITHKRKDSTGTRITHVKLSIDNGFDLVEADECSREQVIKLIEVEKKTIKTAIEHPSEKYGEGQIVIVQEINGVKYIKTVANDDECDNLENLPDF